MAQLKITPVCVLPQSSAAAFQQHVSSRAAGFLTRTEPAPETVPWHGGSKEHPFSERGACCKVTAVYLRWRLAQAGTCLTPSTVQLYCRTFHFLLCLSVWWGWGGGLSLNPWLVLLPQASGSKVNIITFCFHFQTILSSKTNLNH